jgi:16S rRNA (adenine(1408)-N(1))-methyltransferase
VYQSAKANPTTFYLGIDANARPLEKISEKIFRRHQKGGLPNALFVRAAMESLPSELDGVANRVHVQFPWGSLLRAVARGERELLGCLRRICVPGARLEILIALDPERDWTEMQRLGLRPLSAEYIGSVLRPRYRDCGFEILESRSLPLSAIDNPRTTWAKRLSSSTARTVWLIAAQAIPECSVSFPNGPAVGAR